MWAVVVAQLIAWLLPIPEDPGSNPVIGIFYRTYLLLTVCRTDENKEKEAGKGPFFIIVGARLHLVPSLDLVDSSALLCRWI